MNLNYCHTQAPSWILSYTENLANSSLQDGATRWLYYAVGTTHRISLKSEDLSFSFNVVKCVHPNCSPH